MSSRRSHWPTAALMGATFLLLVGVAGMTSAGAALDSPAVPAANAGWEEIGVGSASGGGISDGYSGAFSTVAFGTDGLPIVAWESDYSGDYEIYVRRWNDTAWVEMGSGSATGGGISDNSNLSVGPALAIGTNGVPIVAWHDFTSGGWEIYVRQWNGSSWVEMGNGSASAGGISHTGSAWRPSLAIGPDGAPVVTWYDNSSGSEQIYVLRWDGLAWVEMGNGSASGGGISNSAGQAMMPSLVFATDGAPVVAWADFNNSGNAEIYVRRWNGSAWVEMGSGSASGGGVSDDSGYSYAPSLAAGPDGALLVVWVDESGGVPDIYGRRWNGSTWVEIGFGSASGGGISNSNDAIEPSLAVGPEGTPIVAWEDNSSGNREIYVRQWNGSAWVEMGFGSAGGGGISNTGGASYSPSLAVGPNGAPIVAWNDTSSGPHEIYVRGYPPSCYFLTLYHSGDGDAPTADPTNSAGCAEGFYKAGREILLTANPGGGWRVGGWVGTDNDSSTNYTNTVTMPAADHSAGPIYEPDEINCYFLSLSHTGQGSDPTAEPSQASVCGTGQFDSEHFIALTAAPAEGWHVAGWSGTNDDSSTATTNTLTMPAEHHEVSVAYAPDAPGCYSLDLIQLPSGVSASINTTPDNSTGCSPRHYTAGQTISLATMPPAGWRVKSWSGTANDDSPATTNSLTMPASDHTVSVTYEPIPVATYPLFAPVILYRPATCFPWPSEQEPNNNQSQANGPLCNGQPYTGLPNDSFDVFYFDMPAAGPIAVELNDFAVAGGQLGLLSASFTPIAYDLTPVDGFHINRANEPAGRYYVVVHAAAPDAGAGPYTLRATFATR